jgi:predicted Zn-dependent protease
MHRFPQSKALVYSYAELLHQGGRFNEALRFTDQHLQRMSSDYRLHAIQAKTHAVMGNSLQQHRSRAEYFAARGQIGPAIEQLLFAQQSTDGNFYEQSKVDARLRQLKSLQRENERIQRAGR